MDNDIKYKKLLDSLYELTNNMTLVIFKDYFDENRYLFSLYNEAFNSIKGFSLLLNNGLLIPQACAILRMALERTATIIVLENDKELLNEYIEHQKFRFSLRDKVHNERSILIKEQYGKKCNYNNKPIIYLDYGWLDVDAKNVGINALLEKAFNSDETKNLVLWNNEFNLWVHGTFHLTNIIGENDELIKYTNELIEIVAKLLDIICCLFHNKTGFNFIINDIDYHDLFIKAYKEIQENI